MELLLLIAVGILVFGAVIFDIFTAERPKYQPPKPGTVSDPAVAAMVARQTAYGESLRKEGKSILRPLVNGRPRGHGKSYRPVLTVQAERPIKARSPVRLVK